MTSRSRSDEHYILDLCDAILGLKGLRQHRFDFLRGDPGKAGRTAKLPVDAYYPALNLVIEYRERQHAEPVPVFDQRQTISGMSRGEQRQRYDRRRRLEIPRHNLLLIELSYDDFLHDARKHLIRNPVQDELVIRDRLDRREKKNHHEQ